MKDTIVNNIPHSQDMETLQVSVDGQMHMETVVYTYSGILFSETKILLFAATGMKLETTMLYMRRQMQKEKYARSHVHVGYF